MEIEQLKQILEAAILAAGEPLTLDRMKKLFADEKIDGKTEITTDVIKHALQSIDEDYVSRGIALKEVSSGYRFQARESLSQWLIKLWDEKPPRYSRAVLETLVLIAYRQPITRAEIEEVRGVVVSTHIMRALLDREWVRVLGHRDVPGKPALYGTTKVFLDYFNLKNLEELPPLSAIEDLEEVGKQLELSMEEAESLGNPEQDGEIEIKPVTVESESSISTPSSQPMDNTEENLIEDRLEEEIE